MAEVTDGQIIRIITGKGPNDYYDLGIEKTGISRGSAAETVSGIKTFTAANVHQGNDTHAGTETFNGVVTFGSDSGQILTAETTLTATQIVGSAAGDLGHASGAEVVAAPGAGYILVPVSFVLIYKFVTAAYNAGGNDLHALYPGFASVTGNIVGLDLILAAGDKLQFIYPLSTAGISPPVNTGLSFASTAFGNPGTADGTLRIISFYRKIATGL